APVPVPAAGGGRAAGPGQARARAGGPGGRGGRGGPQTPRFQTLTVQQSAPAGRETVLDVAPVDRANDPAARLLPAGFSMDATGESVTVNGSMVEIDRAQLADRV